jgi:hypothetical protein
VKVSKRINGMGMGLRFLCSISNEQRLRLSGTDSVRNRLMHWFDVGQDKTGGLPSCQRKASRYATGNKNLRPAEQGLLVAPSLKFQRFTTIDSFEDEREKKELDRKRGERATKKKAGTWKWCMQSLLHSDVCNNSIESGGISRAPQ